MNKLITLILAAALLSGSASTENQADRAEGYFNTVDMQETIAAKMKRKPKVYFLIA